MKHIKFVSACFFIGLITTTLTGCSYSQLSDKASESHDFYNKGLGIAFNYRGDRSTNPDIKIDGNTIESNYQIKSYEVPENSSVEEYIYSILEASGADNSQCEVVKNRDQYRENDDYTVYIIDLKNKEIAFTKEELNRIDNADKQSTLDGGPFNGEVEKQRIYNEHLVATCTQYAQPNGLGTSSSSPSEFIYNGSRRLIWVEGKVDADYINEESIVLYD